MHQGPLSNLPIAEHVVSRARALTRELPVDGLMALVAVLLGERLWQLNPLQREDGIAQFTGMLDEALDQLDVVAARARARN
jgi:hypothetical protein